MISNKTVLEQEYKGKKYRLECEIDALLSDAHEVVCNFKTFLVGRMAEHEQAQKQALQSKEVPDSSPTPEGSS